MLNVNAVSFIDCITKNLEDKRYSKDRIATIVKMLEAREKYHQSNGKGDVDASLMAMRDTFDRISEEATERTKRAAKTLTVQAGAASRIQQGFTADAKLFGSKKSGGRGSRGKAIGHSVKAILAPDKRFSGLNYQDLSDVIRRQALALMGDELDKVSVGAFGRQKGKAHLPNVVREVMGVDTGDRVAQGVAKGWLKVSEFLVDSFNAAGGSMKKLPRYLPQAHNAAKMLRHGVNNFITDHMNWVDWTKTRWPDGDAIAPGEREEFLKTIFNTQSSDGVNKIAPKAFRGRGRALGNALEQHRVLHYKGAEAWISAHEKYGDGNPFDVMVRHIGDMAHRTALVDTFGPNPDMMMKNMQAQAKKLAHDEGISQTEINKMEGVFKNVVDPMMSVALRENPMNPESKLAMIAGTVSNLTTSALLGSVALVSTSGDLATTAVIRRLNKMPMTGGMRFYFDSILTDREGARQLANSSGWIFEQSVNHMYSVERFNNVLNVGAAWSRRTADVVLRGSGMVSLTTAARFRAQAEFASYMSRTATKEFGDLPYREVLKRYGITKEDWDVFRNKVTPYEPKPGVKLLRPIDIIGSGVKDETAMFRKFQSMILSESRGMVLDSTTEASVALKGTTRPDTLHGALLHSFSMYKNFPLTFFQTYGQYAMTTKTSKGRLGFIAGLAAATTITGALGVQLNELKNNRDPMPMDNAKFWLKAFLKGGGAGIWGDFLYQTTNTFGGGAADTAAGPLTGVVGDALGVVLKEVGDLYSAEDFENYDSQFPERMVEFSERYFPGSRLWYAQNAFNKLFWEHLENAADPDVSEKRRRRMRNQEKTYGNEYYWEPGEAAPSRGPDFGRMLGDE